MWEILLKEKGGQEGKDQPLGTGTEEEKRERDTERKGKKRQKQAEFCLLNGQGMLVLHTGAHCKVPKGQGWVCQDANVHCPK